MLRAVVAFLVLVNVAVMLWLFTSNNQTNSGKSSSAPLLQGDKLIMVSEVGSGELRPRVAEKQIGDTVLPERPVDAVAAEDDQPPQCVISGPFETRNEAELLADQVSSLGLDTAVFSRKTETSGSIMVYIEPFVSAQEAQRELRVLQSSGVDSFVIADGELDNGISLGVFRTRQNALTQQVRIERLGYETNTRQFMVEEDEFYVNSGGGVLDALADDYWANIANEYKDISIEQKACNEVASEGDFQ